MFVTAYKQCAQSCVLQQNVVDRVIKSRSLYFRFTYCSLRATLGLNFTCKVGQRGPFIQAIKEELVKPEEITHAKLKARRSEVSKSIIRHKRAGGIWMNGIEQRGRRKSHKTDKEEERATRPRRE